MNKLIDCNQEKLETFNQMSIISYKKEGIQFEVIKKSKSKKYDKSPENDYYESYLDKFVMEEPDIQRLSDLKEVPQIKS